MNNHIQKYFSIFSAAVLFMLLLNSNSSFCQSKEKGSSMKNGWAHLKYAIFFTEYDVEHLLADSAQFRKTMEYFAPIKADKVYLTGDIKGDAANVALLKKIAARFRAMGIEADGAMVPVSPRGGPSTYNNPEDLASLKKRMQALAQVFNKIILDDWLFTNATDPQSVADRGDQSWADYRTKLLLEKSKEYIIDPAKEVNPNVKVIIKYPNWYESHRLNGYDVYNETNQFDKMAVGIETRDMKTQDQHIPIYSGYIFQKWYTSVDPSKWVGSWLDNYDMKGEYNDYNAQVYQAVLAQSPEIILWCAGQLYPTNPSSDVYPYFVKKLPEFNKVAGILKGSSRGVPIYLPYGSVGEYNIFGYLGMAGIPLDPVANFPTKSQSAIFVLNSMQDPKLADEMLERLRAGHDVFMTWKLWKKLKNTEFKNTLNFVDYGGTVSSSEFRLQNGFRESIIKANKSFTFPGIETTTWPGVRNVAVVREDYDFGVVLSQKYLNGTIYVLNMPDNSYDLLRLPDQVLNSIRQVFNKELNVTLQGPGGVGMYLFGSNQYVLYNMNETEADVSLMFDKKVPSTGWQELVHNNNLTISKDTSLVRFKGPVISNVSMKLKPFEISIIQAP
ncbi:MAG TPA: hypothetical protein VMV32_09850 [Ignavibacteriaceae bacterium]|nr:hypothetical protein [Ignavibacteriaceae bacterium]